MKAISIILPVYNVEKYIAKCIESIIAQQFNDYELIVIDDCGKDKSIEICETKLEASKIDFQIVHNLSNRGLSESRNIGFGRSSGQYVLFIDSDDWVDPLMLSTLYDSLIQGDADIASCRALRFWEDSGTFSEIPNLEEGLYNSDEYLDLYFKGRVNSEVWGRLYRRTLFESVKFPCRVNNEDLLTLPFLIKQSKKIVQLKTSMYFYVQRDSQSSITDSKPTNMKGFLDKLSTFKSFETSSRGTKANSSLFAYRNLLAVATACIFHSKTFTEAKQDMAAVERFIETADLVALTKGLPTTKLSMILLLKCSPYLFYKFHKITWHMRRKLAEN